MEMGDPLAAAEAARQRVAEQVARAEECRADAQYLANDIRSISATTHSRRGEVSVTAQPSGRVTAVAFTKAAKSLSTSELSHIVSDTIATAQHQAAMNAVERSARTLGEDSEFVTHLRTEAHVAFPAPEPSAQSELRWND